jgi:glycosyltransferase involved in cell wall biosynthesis
MHVCHVNNFLYPRGGSERVMLDEAALLRRRGHTVSFFGRRFPQDTVGDHAEYYPTGVELEQLSSLRKLQLLPRLIYNRETYRRGVHFLQATAPDVLHAHNIYGGLTTAVLDAAARCARPVVMTLHDYKLICPSYLALDHGRVCQACDGGRFYQCLFRRCHKGSLVASAVYGAEAYFTTWLHKYAPVHRFLCPSRFLRERLLANGIAPERAIYLPNAVDAAQCTPAVGGGEYVLYVGRLSHEKGVMTLVRAVAPLAIPVRLVGTGPVRPELAAFIDAHGLGERVRLLGYQTGATLAELYRGAALCVTPSEWYENAPLAVLEAFAYGKPVLGTHLGGIPELVTEGHTGRLVAPGQVEALREAIKALWAERAALGDMGQQARALVLARFAPDQHIAALEGIYHDALPASTARDAAVSAPLPG